MQYIKLTHEFMKDNNFKQLLKNSTIGEIVDNVIIIQKDEKYNENLDCLKIITNHYKESKKYQVLEFDKEITLLSYQMKMFKHLNNKDENRVRDYLKILRYNFPIIERCFIDRKLINQCIEFLRNSGWEVNMKTNSIKRIS